MPDPLKLFISYRSSDASKVDKIARDLALLKHEDGTPRYKPWQDKHNLPPASPHWWDAIVDAIDDNQVFVFHLSQASLSSVVCQAELAYAHKRNRPIIPIVLDGEFSLISTSGKYDLPKETWALVPPWLGERQFLFYTGADFFNQFERAMDVFRKAWPRSISAPRPLNPDANDQTSNHARYEQACDYAERLAFAEAEKHFDALVRRNDRTYGAAAAEWMDLLRRYAELIEVDALPRARFTFKPLWEEYLALFPKDFWEGLFDPKGFAGKSTPPPSRVETPSAAPKGLTAEEYFKRGYDFYKSGDHDRAISDYTEAIRINPQYVDAYHNRGVSYESKEDYDRALADYSEAIRINPQYADAYVNRGAIYNDIKKDYDRAIADYTEAIRLNPQHAMAYSNRGISYIEKKEYDRAIVDLDEAIRLIPQYADAYVSRGIIYNEKKEYDRALADYNEAIRLNPQYATAYSNRGKSYNDKKDYDRAIADYDRALQINPNHPNAASNRKVALDEKKKQGR